MNALAVLVREDDISGLIWFVVFFLFPLVARLFKWLGDKAKGGSAPAEDPGEARRRLREERRQAETEGEDLWKRLARGELPPAAPPERAPVPVPQVRRSLEVEPVEECLEEDLAPAEGSLEEEREPAPLAILGEVRELDEAPEVSLERAAEPVPLTSLGGLERAAAAAASTAPAERSPFLRLARGDLRRAIVLSEVLGPPVSERALRA